MTDKKWVVQRSGAPIAGDFGTTKGQGSPIGINSDDGSLYYLNQESVRPVNTLSAPLNVESFGILPTNSGADNFAAFNSLKALLSSAAVISNNEASLTALIFPQGKTYNFSDTLDIDLGSMIILGRVPATISTGATLQFPAGKTGIRFQRYNTSGANGTTGTGIGSDWSELRNLRIVGGYTTTEGTAHGVHIRSHGITVDRCFVLNFEGNGVNIVANQTVDNGNSNTCVVRDSYISGNTVGIYFDGADTNAGYTVGNDVSNNRQWGIWDSSFLGNTHQGIAENCGICVGTYTPCVVSFGGNRYACVVGQEVGAKTNAPSGTTADNTWWYYIGAGGPDTVTQNIPAWVSGTTYRSGGPIQTDNNNAGNLIYGYYTEVGQGPSQCVWPTLIVGGEHLAQVKGVSTIRHDDTGFRVDLSSPGNAFNVGNRNAAPTYIINDIALQLLGRPAFFKDNPVTSQWQIVNSGGNLLIYTDQAVGAYCYSAGALTFHWDGTSIDLNTGKVLKVAGTQVIGPRVTGWAAATGTATRSTFATGTVTLPQLAEHVKALIDDLMAHGLIGT